MKTIAFFVSLIITTHTIYSQETGWTLYKKIEGINIYTSEVDCYAKNIPNQKAIIIKVENTTDKPIQIEWDRAIWYNDNLVTENIGDGENHMIINVPENSSMEGSCDKPRGPLYLYRDFITYQTDTKLTYFELQNIQVVRL